MSDLYIGLMSGTSMDGIDAALVEFGDATVDILQTRQHEYPQAVRRQLAAAMQTPGLRSHADVAELHVHIGACFRDAAIALLDDAGIDAAAVTAIGSHGQTIRHEPDADRPFSLQAGDPEIIANGTGITTVADFRRADIEQGGQGAPLAPAFHAWLFRQPGAAVVVLNIGGIANVTVLPADNEPVLGFDTGPGNTLLDAWIRRHRGEAFDRDGAWSAAGRVDAKLLARLLADDYFGRPPPKSTGFEYFHLDWLEAAGCGELDAQDVQATLCQLTARSIAQAIQQVAGNAGRVLVCGGGAHNAELMRRLAAELPDRRVATTADAGLHPDWVEAAAFAWLAMRRMSEQPGNLPSVTGAAAPVLLGDIHRPR